MTGGVQSGQGQSYWQERWDSRLTPPQFCLTHRVHLKDAGGVAFLFLVCVVEKPLGVLAVCLRQLLEGFPGWSSVASYLEMVWRVTLATKAASYCLIFV